MVQLRRTPRLLSLDARGVTHPELDAGIEAALRAGDLLIVNDAGTVPASLSGVHVRTGRKVELRLASRLSVDTPRHWRAVAFGEGGWRTVTERRPLPPVFATGDEVRFAEGLSARIVRADEASARLVDVELQGPDPKGDDLWALLFRVGRPIQYAYRSSELELWDQQTAFATVPMSFEPPSAGFALHWGLVFRLRARGVRVVSISHAAGISSTGDAKLDRRLPFPERYRISELAAREVAEARARGSAVIAVGTSVTRALESAAGESGAVLAGEGITSLRIGPGYRRKVVTGILTGLHEVGASHLELLESFISRGAIEGAYAEARTLGYRWHEWGDFCLIMGGGSGFGHDDSILDGRER